MVASIPSNKLHHSFLPHWWKLGKPPTKKNGNITEMLKAKVTMLDNFPTSYNRSFQILNSKTKHQHDPEMGIEHWKFVYCTPNRKSINFLKFICFLLFIFYEYRKASSGWDRIKGMALMLCWQSHLLGIRSTTRRHSWIELLYNTPAFVWNSLLYDLSL